MHDFDQTCGKPHPRDFDQTFGKPEMTSTRHVATLRDLAPRQMVVPKVSKNQKIVHVASADMSKLTPFIKLKKMK
jgi:hypothetical protein